VAGVAAVGKQLTGLSGTWAGSGSIAYAFQWYRCDAAGAHCAAIRGATAAGYRLVRRDAGKTIGLTVSATDATGSNAAYAPLVGPVAGSPVLESTVQPEVAGSAVVGETLSVSTGGWSPTPAALTYTWQRCNANGRLCAPIPAATGDSYTVAPDDFGHALLVVVEAVFGSTSQSALSTATPAAAGPEVVGPENLIAPSVIGIEAQGAQLRAAYGTWTGADPISYAYRWYRCDTSGAHCLMIAGATRLTYRLVAKDVGRTLGLTVLATDTTGTARAYAGVVGPIARTAAPEEATVQPQVTGDAKVGVMLAVSNGTWSPAPTRTGYTWYRCNRNGRVCGAIPGAVGPTYTTTPADTGHRLTAVVTAVSATGKHAVFSTATPPVA
jgi:fibronectin-binding autotransporter adhesin